MKLPGEDESVGTGLPVIYMVIGVSAFVLIMLFAIMKSSRRKSWRPQRKKKLRRRNRRGSCGRRIWSSGICIR